MRVIVFILFLVTYPLAVVSQNLVQNSGFENNSGLPLNIAQWMLASNWSNANSSSASPDYLHTNGSGMVQLPNTIFGSVNPFQGNAVMGLALWYSNETDFREYISQSLATPLTVGGSYTFSFYISNGTPSNYGGTGIQNIQVDFSVNPINQIGNSPLGYTPLLSNGTMTYSNNWSMISYTFIATAPYAHFAIGNFMDDANTVTQQFEPSANPCAYYFIDSVSLTLSTSNTINVIGNSQICLGDTAILQASNSVTYAWADSLSPGIILDNDSILSVTPATTTTYFVYGNNDTTSFTVNVFDPTTVNLGNDTSLCVGATLTLDATTTNATYLWQDNSTNSTFNVTQQGIYWVQVTLNSCSYTDTINVSYYPFPTVDLGNDTSFCRGETLILDATTLNAIYLWQDNSTNPTFNVTQQGIYWTEVTVNNCSTIDTILIAEEDCEIILEIPNVFTPNNDGINDLFVPINSKGIVSMYTIICNRWGNKIYETDNLFIEWDGQGVTDGTYFWIVNYTDIDGTENNLHGYVTINN